MTEKFNQADMNNIISELNLFLNTELNTQIEKNLVELCNVNDESGHFVLSAHQSSTYEIYLRFNEDYKNDYGRHKTLVISVLSFKDHSEKMETAVLRELVRISKKYGYTYIMYAGITENIKAFAIKLGFKGYSDWLRPFEIEPNDTSFSLYVTSTEQLFNNFPSH
ncbi:Hypothetical protein F387_01760 [Wohlfahrtiimonas chitiniclastica SH04]|uniref:Uncharacterized protein n=1 Tax=Wohlfahrtiimonas chitiniclastica SH04 TaxID=1261130 RepID=L8Y1U0_9GAMM|nr:hypothetical protein [Wohlfahrtiimonas chitiniclastica]ELV08441.1 Hypothetical protein F387_01760 [Wohlfahrtiimonas chitiniclastica SH04]MBS7815096.1 hypothetical protein [Wohlfahrtiimonas chitiniclastica]